MNTPYLKKLIVGFLVLAALTTSSSLLFLSAPPAPQGALTPDAVPTTIPQNAFVESLPGETSTSTLATTLPSSNLTDNLTSRLAQEIVKVNPEGPQDAGGGPSVLAPDADTLAGAISTLAQQSSSQLPDWEKDIKGIKINLTNDTSDATDHYHSSLNTILGKLSSSIGVADPTVTPFTLNDPEGGALAFARAVKDLSALPVPASLATFHRSLLKLFVYERNAVSLAAGGDDDPLRSALVFQQHETSFETAMTDFETQLQEIQGTAQNDTHSPLTAFLRETFGIKTAHAQFGGIVHDPFVASLVAAFHAGTLARTVWEWAQKVILDTVKDQLVHRLVNQVIGWAQGGGKPQFITNWKAFLKDTQTTAIDSTISKLAPSLCSSFGPLIQLHFQRVNTIETPVSCTLDKVVRNIKDFANDFRNGGWIAYSESLKPSNNFFGALIETNDTVITEAATAQTAKQQDAAANKGYNPTRICVKASVSGGGFEDIMTQSGNNYFDIPLAPGVMGPMQRVYCEAWSTTSPGGLVAGQLDKALGSPIDRIVSAQDFTNLVSALINSGLSKLIKAGVNGLQGVINGGGAGSSSGSRTTADCQGFTGAALQDCLSNGQGNNTQQQSDLSQVAQSYKKQWQDYADANAEWLAIGNQVSASLSTIISQCPDVQSQASINLSFIAGNSGVFSAEGTRATNAVASINSIITAIGNAASSEAISNLTNSLNPFDPTTIATQVSQIETRVQDITQLRDQIVPFTQCPTTLTPLK